MVALCSRLFSLSVRWGHRADNPAKRVERNKEYGRRLYAKGEEVRRPRIATHTYIAIRKKRPSRGSPPSSMRPWPPTAPSRRRQRLFRSSASGKAAVPDNIKAVLKRLLLEDISPQLRHAIAVELGISLQRQQRDAADKKMEEVKRGIEKIKARMRSNGERPRGGIHRSSRPSRSRLL